MKVLVCVFLSALIRSCVSSPRPQYGQPLYAEGPAVYDFSYGVSDALTGVNFGHSEARDGVNTRGSYFVSLPDGRLQTVDYRADDAAGYIADVKYTGEGIVPAYGPPPRPVIPAYVPAPAPAPVYAPAPAPAPVYAPAPAPAPVYAPAPAPAPVYAPAPVAVPLAPRITLPVAPLPVAAAPLVPAGPVVTRVSAPFTKGPDGKVIASDAAPAEAAKEETPAAPAETAKEEEEAPAADE